MLLHKNLVSDTAVEFRIMCVLHDFFSESILVTYQYINLMVGPVKMAAFCILSILSGFEAWALAGKMISFTVMNEKIDKTAAMRNTFDAMLKPPSASSFWLA